MATDLFLISNIHTTKEEILAKKEFYLGQLKALQLEHITVIGIGKLEGDWEYELPEIYDDVNNKIIPDEETSEIIHFRSPFEFSLSVYENCLEISTIYKYSFLYPENEIDDDSYIWQFRKEVHKLISLFGGTEVIYLADNGCDKLAMYLECQVWEGVSYQEIKNDMILNNLPFTSDYKNLDYDNLSYSNIKEIIFDDFKDLTN